MIILHLLHECPPDRMWGIGRTVESILQDKRAVHIAGSLAMPLFMNYRSGPVPRNWIRGAPSQSADICEALSQANHHLVRAIYKQDMRPNVIHCHDWLVWPAAATLSRNIGCPVISTLYTLVSIRRENGWFEGPPALSQLAEEMQLQILKHSSAVAVPDRASTRYCLEKMSDKQIFNLIPPGTHTEFGVPTNPAIPYDVIYAGRLSEEKGIEILIDALSGMNSPPSVAVYGDGRRKNSYRALADRRGVRITWYPYEESQDLLYNQGRVLAVPSLYDTGPLVAIEAAARGKPVVVSDACGACHLLERLPNVIPVRNHSVSDFSRGLSVALQLPSSQRVSLKDTPLDAAVMIDAYRNIYDRVCRVVR